MCKRAQWSVEPEFEAQEEGAKWVGRSAGNNGSRGDGGRCQGWYTFRGLKGESYRSFDAESAIQL